MACKARKTKVEVDRILYHTARLDVGRQNKSSRKCSIKIFRKAIAFGPFSACRRLSMWPFNIIDLVEKNTVRSRLYVQIGTQKFGRRTERDVEVKIIFRITPCKVFWIPMGRANERNLQLRDVQLRLYCKCEVGAL